MNWKSIRTKLIVFMLLATTIPIVTTMIVTYAYSTHSMKERAVEVTGNLLHQGKRNVTTMLEELNRSSLNVYSDAELYRQLQTQHNDFQTDSRVFASLSYILSSVQGAHQLYFYESIGKRAMVVTNAVGAKRLDNVTPFLETLSISGQFPSTTLEPTHRSHTYGFAVSQPQQQVEQVFSLHRKIERIPSNETLGYLSIDVKLSMLTDIVEQLYDQKEEELYVVDENGFVVFADNEQLQGKKLEAAWYENVASAGSMESGHFEQDGALLVYNHVETNVANWTIVKRIPNSYLIREANHAAVINLLLLAMSLVVIVVGTIFVSLRITAPIKQLVRYMSQVQAGNLNVPMNISGKDEISLATLHFRNMMDTVNNLILREYKLELANKTNQLRALQAQINPHFLNNTIQIIGTLALELGVPRIYALLSALARMMRYSMDNASSTITLKGELAHLKAYIELQKERYENRFEYEVDVDDSMLTAEMPKMILQPIIENYFKHGMDKSSVDGRLKLSARWRDKDILEIVIENNGLSIRSERLDELQRELSCLKHLESIEPFEWSDGIPSVRRNSDEVSHLNEHNVTESIKLAQSGAEPKIGLNNVFARMRMVYGDQAQLEVSNIKPQGVRVTLVIKKRIEKDGNDEGADRG